MTYQPRSLSAGVDVPTASLRGWYTVWVTRIGNSTARAPVFARKDCTFCAIDAAVGLVSHTVPGPTGPREAADRWFCGPATLGEGNKKQALYRLVVQRFPKKWRGREAALNATYVTFS